jgi:ABC-type branched-subunit amino acid transport system ATPase component
MRMDSYETRTEGRSPGSGPAPVRRGVALVTEHGESVVLLGRNGMGRTSALRLFRNLGTGPGNVSRQGERG